MLQRLLTHRFGDLPATALASINQASKAQIEAWFDHAIEAATLEEVFQDLAH